MIFIKNHIMPYFVILKEAIADRRIQKSTTMIWIATNHYAILVMTIKIPPPLRRGTKGVGAKRKMLVKHNLQIVILLAP